jgi:hypothetical protein
VLSNEGEGRAIGAPDARPPFRHDAKYVSRRSIFFSPVARLTATKTPTSVSATAMLATTITAVRRLREAQLPSSRA